MNVVNIRDEIPSLHVSDFQREDITFNLIQFFRLYRNSKLPTKTTITFTIDEELDIVSDVMFFPRKTITSWLCLKTESIVNTIFKVIEINCKVNPEETAKKWPQLHKAYTLWFNSLFIAIDAVDLEVKFKANLIHFDGLFLVGSHPNGSFTITPTLVYKTENSTAH